MESVSHKSNKTLKSVESHDDIDVTFFSSPDILVHLRVERLISKDQQDVPKKSATHTDPEPWGILFSVFCFNTLMGYHFLCFSMYYITLTEAFDTTKAAAGLILSLHAVFAAVTGMVASALEENFGPRLVSIIGCLILFTGIFTSTFATSIYALCITYGAIAGIGTGLVMLVNGIMIQKGFHKNRNMATAISACGIPVGNMISPIFSTYLLETFGWRSTFLLHSAILLHGLLFAMTYRPSKKQQFISKSFDIKSLLKSICDFSFLKDLAFVLILTGNVLIRFNTATFVSHSASRAVYIGYDMNLAAYLLTIIFTSSFITRSLMSVIMKFKFPNPILMFGVSGLLQALVSIGMPFGTNYAHIVVCTVMFGIGQGLIVPVIMLSLVKLAGVEKYGKSRALTNLFANLSQFSTSISGWIFDVTLDYNIPFYVSGLIGATGSVCILITFCIYKVRREKSKASKNKYDNGKHEHNMCRDKHERIRTFTF